MKTRALLSVAAALLVALSACTDQTPTAAPGDEPGLSPVESIRVLDWTSSGLEQEVKVTPARFRVGDTVTVRSTVRNTGTRGTLLEARICGLDVEGALDMEAVDPRCRGWSARRTLAPGESFTVEDRRVYRGALREGERGGMVRVRHLLDPERWIQVELSPRD